MERCRARRGDQPGFAPAHLLGRRDTLPTMSRHSWTKIGRLARLYFNINVTLERAIEVLPDA